MPPSTRPWTVAHLDDDFANNGHTYTLTRIYRLTSRANGQAVNRTVRITVRRDFYSQQSHAQACVLTDDLTWTDIVAAAPDTWFPGTPTPSSREVTPACLTDTANALLERARRVLPTATPRTRPPCR